MNAQQPATHITLVTPAPPGSRAGNRATAERWAGLLRQAGFRVTVVTEYQGEPTDLLIALHSWRSHQAVQTYRQHYPQGPLLVVLTGTDVYRFQYTDPEVTHATMAAADVLVGLHRRLAADIPARFRDRLRVVLQSADAPERAAAEPRNDRFEVCVIGHLREEKDSLRAAYAARLLPAESGLHLLQAGKPHNEEWRTAVQRELARNPRLEWLGELDREATQALMIRARLMVISSVMEGGANVVSEACRAGLPVIASDIPGNRGLLGDDYPGYYPPKDEAALAELLLKAEQQPDFLQELTRAVSAQAVHFTPEAEQAALVAAVNQALRRIGSMASP
ncbi:MAG: selenoneine biosynthesis selenosugar synthase SenB [Marinobacter sp.]|uniref:selenoneine biosynthesis selenosugar synthase SenB n=1 Tax=Marinobacter sp. TaxID=50741 RepID=UPI00299EEEE1|nr:selenoneine biosynthesis selenosugar synthase SenB [Marinobacter sp.]MDX1634098.1 selenoneine biosynthesis selenosugar synthase SenB [Marinobacter sp.]